MAPPTRTQARAQAGAQTQTQTQVQAKAKSQARSQASASASASASSWKVKPTVRREPKRISRYPRVEQEEKEEEEEHEPSHGDDDIGSDSDVFSYYETDSGDDDDEGSDCQISTIQLDKGKQSHHQKGENDDKDENIEDPQPSDTMLLDEPEPEIPEIERIQFMSNKKLWKAGLDATLPPIDNLEEIFDDIARRAMANNFQAFLNHLASRKLRVVTMCSGTESPLLAMEMVGRSMLHPVKTVILFFFRLSFFLSSLLFSLL
ncbi:hypothetical protein VTN77DRAFT_6576 [Rasamsonia byssochlamydoides]|uniref:uncharacterized protein n=1 Tax=Rasamsonia byssochlamydoides TaxID=89139 RepID=UPI0037422796